jgi:hypothetical protein
MVLFAVAIAAPALYSTACWDIEGSDEGPPGETLDPGGDPWAEQTQPGPADPSAVGDQPALDPSSYAIEGGEGVDPWLEDLPDLPEMCCVAPDREDYMETNADPDDEDAGKEHTILFVFDKSGSMVDPWEAGTKWEVAAAAMVDSVTLYQHYLSAGAIFFPTDDDCGVLPISTEPQIYFTDGYDYLNQWQGSMNGLGPSGMTPMNTAFVMADEAIRTACEDGILERPFKVVLLTDGQPNCNYDPDYLAAYPYHWFKHGIETLVVGLPGSEGAAELLSMIAYAGGTESNFVPDDEEDFEDEMDAICE